MVAFWNKTVLSLVFPKKIFLTLVFGLIIVKLYGLFMVFLLLHLRFCRAIYWAFKASSQNNVHILTKNVTYMYCQKEFKGDISQMFKLTGCV